LERATPATTDDNLLPFAFPAVERKKVTAAFDGGRLSSDGGVMLLSQAERRLGLAERLAAVIPDERDASRVTHLLPDILRARIFAIACGYEDADDLDRLRSDPTFKLACGRLPDTGIDLRNAGRDQVGLGASLPLERPREDGCELVLENRRAHFRLLFAHCKGGRRKFCLTARPICLTLLE